jgi:hypothetical protein
MMAANQAPVPKTGLTVGKNVIMEEKRRDLNRQAGHAGGGYDEDCK